MLAHHQSGLLNAADLGRALGIDGKTVGNHIDLLVDLLLLRRLPPWHANSGKRLVKSPKTYVRDSGLLHALLGLSDGEAILGHPVAGASWEGFIIETLIAIAPPDTTASFYRTSAGAEIDLLLTLPGQRLWAVEIKRSLSPKPEKGFLAACDELRPDRRLVVYPGAERFGLGREVEALDVATLAGELSGG
jgi:predicted AAA+ superfamily ATPase